MGMEVAQAWWVEDKEKGWKSLVAIMSGVVFKHLQTYYMGL